MLAPPPPPSPASAPTAALPPPAVRDRYWWRLLPALAALALLVRVPSFTRPLWNPDEGYLAVQARMLAAGGSLYDTVVDRKPPLVPWLYQASFALTGDTTLLGPRLLAVLSWLLTAAFTASLARRHAGPRAGIAAGILCLFLSAGLSPADSQAASFEVFMLPATVAAVWCADRAHWCGAGLALAAAFLAKQTGLAVLLPLLWCVPHRAPAGDRARALGLLLGSAALPVLLAALATAPRGFLFWTLTGSGDYLAFSGSLATLAGRALVNTALLAAAVAGVLPAALAAVRARRTGLGPATGWLWLWLAGAALATALGLRFFGHYFLHLVPPLALLGAGALAQAPRRARRTALAVCAGCCALFLAWGLLAPRTGYEHSRRVAAEIARRTAPGEAVLVWGMHPETYWLAHRPPASRYLTAGLLTNFGGGRTGTTAVGEKWAVRGAWPTFRRELTTRPPALVVDDARGAPYRLSRTPTLRSWLRQGYVREGGVDGAVVYVRRGE
ncbi:glycosyltransferase family 39 protein [Streptomyces sp. DSM 41982]|uniref:Glycosyltransferase family 39 protein n=1 Tax=Streptomyces evansiae TaxID=3075535 RepID=A0ABD5DZM1_9ACTN|nr:MULTISPECIES: glycosyltransferase family 39 protein [unclassified Streptomyces]MDT0414545.1 glycosyltransferase family 39 protein [Streptomyces sp. DSM 41982]SCE20559.1 4-amino-4-deoxy-L-arabinose transferase [Streptomyces sp. SolWspMP-sol7th]